MTIEIKTIQAFILQAQNDDSRSFQKAVKLLEEVYGNPRYFDAMTKTFKWPVFLKCVHKMVKFEAELFNTSHRNASKNRVMNSAIMTAVEHANVYIERSEFLFMIKEVLSQDSYSFYHNTYLIILKEHFLMQPIDKVAPTMVEWKEILNLLIHCYENASSKYQKNLILCTMGMVVELGCNNSNLSLDIKAILGFVGKVFNDIFISESTDLLLGLLEVAYTVYFQISPGHVLSLCAYGEKFLPDLINMKECNEKYRILLLFVQIYGTNESILMEYQDKFKINNWKRLISNIYMNIMFKTKKEFSSDLVNLGCEVFRIVLQDPKILQKEGDTTAIKKICILDIIMNFNADNYGFMLQVVNCLLKKYTEYLKEENFIFLLEAVKDAFIENLRNKDIIMSLCDISTSLIIFEKNYKSLSDDVVKIQRTWVIICTIILRGMTVYKFEEANYTVLHHFINRDTRLDKSIFLNSYILKLSVLSPINAEILYIFCKEHLWKHLDNTDNKKLQLLHFILNIQWEQLSFCIPINKLSYMITFLVGGSVSKLKFNTFDEDKTNSVTDFVHEIYNKSKILCLNEIAKYHNSLKCTMNLFKESQEISSKDDFKICSSGFVCENNKQILMANLTKLATEVAHPEMNSVLSIRILKLVYLMKVTTDLKRGNVIHEDKADTVNLRDLIKEGLSKVLTKVTELNGLEPNFNELINIFESLFVLYSKTSYDDESLQIVVSQTSTAMLKHLFMLSKNNHESLNTFVLSNGHINHGHTCQKKYTEVRMTKRELLKICTIRILTSFCCLILQRKVSLGQHEMVLHILLSDKWINQKSVIDIKLVIKVLESFKDLKAEHHCGYYLSDIIKLTMVLYCKMHRNTVISIFLLRMMPRLFYLAMQLAKDDSSPFVNLSVLFYNYYQAVSKSGCGLPLSIEFVRCLYKIIQFDQPMLLDALKRKQTMVLFDVLGSLLTSSFYPVRLETAKCVYRIFASNKVVSKQWKLLFVQHMNDSWMKSILSNSYKKLRNIYEQLDFTMTRAASTVATLAAIICNENHVIQCEALLMFFKLKVKLDFSCDYAKKVLKEIMESKEERRYIIENNLNFLLTSWLTTEFNYNTFPWDLLGFSSQKEFYKMHLQTLFSTLIINDKYRDHIPKFIEVLGLSLSEVIELSFTSVIIYLFSNQEDKYAFDLLRKLKDGEREFKLSKSYKTLLNDNVHEIVIYIVSKLNDEQHFRKTFEITRQLLPDEKLLSNSPQFTIVEMCDILEILYSELGLQDSNLIKFLVTKYPTKLQKIITHFTIEFNNKKVSNGYCLKVLQQYAYVCQMIAQEIHFSYFDDLSPYVIRDISYTLVHLIKDSHSDPIFANASGVCLYLFLKYVLLYRSSFAEEYLNVYVQSLCKQFQYTTPDHEITLRTLRFLFIENERLFVNYIERINPLPEPIARLLNIPETTDSLEIALKRFIKYNQIHDERDLDDIFVVENLSYIKKQLSSKNQELNQLIIDLDRIGGFTEDCTTSLIHQLIHRLVKYTNSSVLEIKLEAVSCLGILGLNDLNSLTLYPDKLIIKEVVDCEIQLSYQTVVLLTHLLVKNDVNLRKVCCETLYDLLELIPYTWVKELPSQKTLRNLEAAMNKKKHIWHKTSTEYILRIEHIYPFIFGLKSQIQSTFEVDQKEFNRIVNVQNDLWTVKSNELSYQDWTKEVCSSFANCLKNSYIKKLIPVFELSTTFCAEILPRMIYLIVRDNSAMITKLSLAIDAFFCSHQKSNKKTIQTIRCMLNVINYFRVQNNKSTTLAVNYLKTAQAALSCNSLFTASLFVETWSIDFLNRNPHNDANMPVLDHIYQIDSESGKVVHGIIREVYASIGLSDVIYCCSSLHCKDRSFLTQYYIDTNQWDKVLLMKDAELQWQQSTDTNISENTSKELFNAMYHLDLHQMLVSMQNLTFTNNSEVTNCAYESAWRLSDWNLMPTSQWDGNLGDNNSSPFTVSNYALYHYKALKLIHESKIDEMRIALNKARESVIDDLYNISFESTTSIKPYLLEVQMLQEIEEMSEAKNENKVLELNFNWQNQCSLNKMEYFYAEPILYQRVVTLQVRDSLKNVTAIKNVISSVCLKLMELAKQYGHMRVVLLLLDDLKNLKSISDPMKFELEFQKANIIWTGKNLEHGRRCLQDLLQNENIDNGFRARCMEASATWAAEAQTEHPQDIATTYQNALRIFETAASFGEMDTNTLLKARLNMARFVDKEYLKLSEQMKSAQYQVLKRGVENISSIIPNQEKNPDIRIAKHYKKRNLMKDAIELQNIENQKNKYLLLAVESYALNLQQSDNYDSFMFRLIALWLSNINNSQLAVVIKKYVPTIPSYKFLLLIPQLIPRLNSTVLHFSQNVKLIIVKCAREHPYHTLPALLAMKHQYEDMKYNNNPQQVNPRTDPKTAQVANLIEELKEDIGDIISETEKLSMALIMLAYWKIKPKGSSVIAIPRTQDLAKIRNFQHVAVPTLNINIRPNARYNDIVTVVEYKHSFEYVGGINAPKKVICVGSDGICRPQLLKGQDDMKQDAMMQQIFSAMNILLNEDENASKNKLKIRTYKIVPLSQRSGILEWCDNTIPLGIILIGKDSKSGIHKKYYPKDLTAKQCKEKMGEVTQMDDKTKYKIFTEICRNFHPAFHHFFIETYQSPEIWFERRLNYTRSVAVSSIIGYVLGIGDRHLNNILFDQKTAEVIHIDFGYAFDQGKVLPIPEIVPFRLTRDIEAAMGVYGAQGLMKHNCVQIMRILRQNEETILMVLEVLLYGPIYLWTVLHLTSVKSSGESLPTSSSSSDEEGINDSQKNNLAKKALWLIQQKLQGTERYIQVDVTCQIQTIIHEARDPHNLSRMYCGWQPYL